MEVDCSSNGNDLSKAMSKLSCHESTAEESKEKKIRELEALISHLKTENSRLSLENTRLLAKVDADRKLAQLSNAFLCAKGNRHAALHAIFNLTHTNKIADLKKWARTGSIHTRDGLLHWKFDARLLRNQHGETILHTIVIERGKTDLKLEAVKFFIEELEFDPNTVDLYGRTPMHFAALAAHVKIIEYLLVSGGDPLVTDEAGMTPLLCALSLSRPNEEVVKLLVLATQDAERKTGGNRRSITAALPPCRKEQKSSSSTTEESTSLPPPFPAVLERQRQPWYYAVLYKAATFFLPGDITVTCNSTECVASENVSNYFPTDDRLLLGSKEYVVRQYNHETSTLVLDRPYEGEDGVLRGIFLGYRSTNPPYISVKRILEEVPGNPFEDKSGEQELFQDYQFLDPESEYEAAMKLGPVTSLQEAQVVASEWNKRVKEAFMNRICTSKEPACQQHEDTCLQRTGEMTCIASMSEIGKKLAKEHFGKIKYAKALKPRALIQRKQDYSR